MHVVMSGDEWKLEAMDREMSREFIEEFYKRLEELWAYVGLFRINDRRRTTRKEEILRRQRTVRATKVQIQRYKNFIVDYGHTPGENLYPKLRIIRRFFVTT